MQDTFIKRENKVEPGFNIGVILNRKATAGTVGLEIEVEGANLPKAEGLVPKQWAYHHDGSLRGEDNAEYVLVKPLNFNEIEGALASLWNVFASLKSRLDESNRTSVHVHLNCQSFHMNRVTAFIALYLCFEEVLTEWCGEHRVGNLFCLRAKDAPAAVTMIRRFIRSDGKTGFPESLHYAGLNVHALVKFGSLEVRSLRGVSDQKTILDWVSILQRLYEVSESFTDPRDICADFSRLGPTEFFEMILGDRTNVVRAGIEMNEDRIRDSLYEGIRIAQDLCYCRDWDAFKQINVKADPFGRDVRKIAKKLAAQEGAAGPEVYLPDIETAGNPFEQPNWGTPNVSPFNISLQQATEAFFNATQNPVPVAPEPEWGDEAEDD